MGLVKITLEKGRIVIHNTDLVVYAGMSNLDEIPPQNDIYISSAGRSLKGDYLDCRVANNKVYRNEKDNDEIPAVVMDHANIVLTERDHPAEYYRLKEIFDKAKERYDNMNTTGDRE